MSAVSCSGCWTTGEPETGAYSEGWGDRLWIVTLDFAIHCYFCRISGLHWTALHDRLHRTLRQRGLLGRDASTGKLNQGKVLVAVSGGQDSLCALALLRDLQPKWGWQLGVAHCDHGWRVDSGANAAHVRHLAERWQLPFYLQTANRSLSSEGAARQWRYDALAAIATQNHYTHLVTGHTASDRAETLLYNLMRGSGADGLQALTWQRPLCESVLLVRPLLTFSRAETAQFCQDFQLPLWEDSTNQDLKYARNRIRQELLPYLRSHFNAQVEQHLSQTAELLQAEVEYLETAAQTLFQQATSPETPNLKIARLNRRILRTAPLAIQRRVIRRFLQQALPCAPRFEQVEKCTVLIQAPNRSRTDPFPGGAIAETNGDWLQLI